MGERVQDPRPEEEQADRRFAGMKSLEEEIREKRGGEETSPQAVERKERSNAFEPGAGLGSHAQRARFGMRFDRGSKRARQEDRGKKKCARQKHRSAMRVQRLASLVDDLRGNGHEQRTKRVPRVLEHVVPSDRARTFAISDDGGKNRLLDDEGGATITAHAVHHSEERRHRKPSGMLGDEERRATGRARERDLGEKPAAAVRVGPARRQQRGDGASGQPRPDDDPDQARRQPASGEKKTQLDADHSGRDGAEERAGENLGTIAHPFSPPAAHAGS